MFDVSGDGGGGGDQELFMRELNYRCTGHAFV